MNQCGATLCGAMKVLLLPSTDRLHAGKQPKYTVTFVGRPHSRKLKMTRAQSLFPQHEVLWFAITTEALGY